GGRFVRRGLARNGLLLVGRRFFRSQHALRGEIARPLERRHRRVVPDALQIGIAPRRAGRRPRRRGERDRKGEQRDGQMAAHSADSTLVRCHRARRARSRGAPNSAPPRSGRSITISARMSVIAALIAAQAVAASAGFAASARALVHQEFVFETAPFASAHASTVVDTREGLVAAWFGGTREGAPDVGIWLSRHVDGKWTP